MDRWVVSGFAEERQLGSGASGRVVAAVHQVSGQRVAIKYLASRLFRDPGFLAGFRAEADLLKSLADPHVVRLFDYVEEPGQGAAIVMELVDGASLHQMITRQGPTTPESALAVLKGSLLGLAAAHALGIVHRDYKPENVLVEPSGTSKLTDFGVATRTGRRAEPGGTPLYMAPEQWEGSPATPATDIYAATVVFFECLTGMTPFSGQLGQLQQQHQLAAVPVEVVAEPLRDLITRGMAKDPVARPANAMALVTELEATAAAAYGRDWEARGLTQLAERAAALLLLLLHGPAAVAGGSGTATTSTTLVAPKAAAAGKLAGLSGWQAAALFAGVFAVAAGTLVGISAARGGFRAHGPSPSRPGAAAALPSIAYATTTALYTRTGTAPPDVLAPLAPGTQASQFTWSYDGRWLGWFSGPAATGTDQVHITDVKTRVTKSWPCAGCVVGAFQDGHLLVRLPSAPTPATLTAFPEDGGPATTVSLSGPALSGSPQVLASTPHDAAVLFFAGNEISGGLYETTLAGRARLVSRLPFPAGPGGDRVLGGAGLTGISPDGAVLAYGCNYLGGDPGQGSDCVTIVNLVTGVASVTRLPADQAQPLRISAVWVDSAGQVYATAWHQPGNVATTGTVPRATVIPHQYRLDNGHWTDTGPRNLAAAGGRDGWIASLEEPASIMDFSARGPGQLVATLGTKQMVMASNVTAFAWAPA